MAAAFFAAFLALLGATAGSKGRRNSAQDESEAYEEGE